MIGEIEAAILAQLKTASDAGLFGPKLRAIDSVSGRTLDKTVVLEAIANAPAAWVAFLEASPTENDFATTLEIEARYAVILVDRHLGGNGQARQGSLSTRGAYPMAIDALRLLHGQNFNLAIGALEAGTIAPLFNDLIDGNKAAFVSAEFATRFALPIPDGVDALADFATFHADWDVKPFLDPAPETVPLADGQADATDTVQLEN